MPRPRSKDECIVQAEDKFEKMMELIEFMPVKVRQSPFHFDAKLLEKQAHWSRDKNIRDIYVHLYEWHQLLLSWVKANESGKQEPLLPFPYNWKTYGEMNQAIWLKHQECSEEQAEKMLNKSHQEVMRLIDSHTDEELFTKQYYPWTGTSNLGSYCISVTSAHYEWAIKKLKAHIKACKTE